MLQDALLKFSSLVGFRGTVRADHSRRHAAKYSSTLRAFIAGVRFLFLFVVLAVSLSHTGESQSFLSDRSAALISDETVTKATASQSLALHYTFSGRSLALLVMANGNLHAYDLEHGNHVWCTSTGDNMTVVTVDQPPSKETILGDPLALPFFVRGNSLFTRIPFLNHHLSSRNAAEGLEELPQAMQPYFFMNISTLLRRQAVFVDGTDVYVTSSIQVADLDVHSGRLVGPRDAQSQSFKSCNFTSSTSGADASQGSRSIFYNELLPHLHIVRYNIAIHAVKAGQYSWSIRLSQLRLVPNTATQSGFSPHFPGKDAAYSSSATSRDGAGEEAPRFFSKIVRNIFDFDDAHTVNVSYKRAPEQETERTRSMPSSRALLFNESKRWRTYATEYLSRMVALHQLNATHVSLRSIRDGTSAWTSVLPPVTCDSSSNAATVAASSVNTTPVTAAYVWVRESDEIFRIPVLRWASSSVLEKEEQLRVPAEEGASIPADAHIPRPLPTSPTGEIAVGGLQLTPFLGNSDVGFPYSHDSCATAGWPTDDVEADEREEMELAAYYDHHLHWGEPLWPSPSLLGSFKEGDNGRSCRVMGPATSPKNLTNVNNPYSSKRPASAVEHPGTVVKTGLAWRTAAVISFHVLCLAASIAFLCAGVPPRGQLQRAWTQADRSRDRVSYTSSSRPQSAQLVPQDLLSPPGEGSTPFSLVLDSTLIESHGQWRIPTAYASAVSESLYHPDHAHHMSRQLYYPDHPDKSSLHSPWVNPTPEQLYTMMCDDDGEENVPSLRDAKGITATDGTATPSSVAVGLTSPSTDLKKSNAAILAERTFTASSSNVTGGVASTDPAVDACHSSSDDDTIDIDLGERWWLRAQHPPLLRPGTTTPDEALSDHLSSFSRSQANTGTDEEGKLFQLHFKVLEKIGCGGEGSVFCVEHRVTHARYAIKAIHIHEQDEERVVQEAVLHSSFDNANVVRFYFCWIEDIAVSTANRLDLCNRNDDGFDTASLSCSDNSPVLSTVDKASHQGNGCDTDSIDGGTYRMLFIQMEYFSRGTLADWLRLRTGFFRLEVLDYMRQIGEGLAYLHNQDVLHRDLKPTNIFVSNDNILKIGDFGLAKRRGTAPGSTVDLTSNVVGGHQERSVVGGSPLYCSPEQTRGDPVNKPSDIFSLGIIAVELLCTFTTLHERIRILTDAHQMILPVELETEFPDEAQLIKSMLATDPLLRPPIRKVLRQINKLIVKLDAEESNEEVEGAPLHRPLEEGNHSASLNQSHKTTNTVLGDEDVGETVAIRSTEKVHSKDFLTSSTPQGTLDTHSTDADHAVNSLTNSCVGMHDTLPLPLQERKARTDSLPVWRTESTTPTSVAVPSTGAAVNSVTESSAAPLGQRIVGSGNTYHSRRCLPMSSNAETSAGRSLNTELSMTDGVSANDLFASDPYGAPSTPVMYVGDADLSTILKRDFQDRSVSATD